MTQTERISETLLRYGTFKVDISTEEKEGCRRIRIIQYDYKKWFHHMFNGEIVELFEL
jgi:hypothetical protein